MLGIEKGKVRLEEYDNSWKAEFEKEKHVLEKLIGKYFLKIEHVGSTSIPGMKAKPIIDIAVVVKKLKSDNEYIEILKNAGYEYRDDNAVKGEHLFEKVKNNLTTHFIHVIEKDSTRWLNYILFKEYLLENKDEIKKYIELKEKLSVKYKDDRERYTKLKNDYIINIINKKKEELKSGIK